MPDPTLIIQNCQALLPDLSVMAGADIRIAGDRIVQIEPHRTGDLAPEGATILDGRGKLAMPGMTDAHTHAAQQLLRGSVMDELPMIWARILVPFESNLTLEDVYAGAMLFCVENIKAGITNFADAGGPFMEAVAQAALETGMRATITRSTMDCGSFIPPSMMQPAQKAVAATEQLYREYHGQGNDRIHIWFGLRQAMTSTPELVEAVSIRSKELKTGVHIHLAEHLDEVSHCLTRYQMRPAEWFDKWGLLGPNLIAAHSVRLADREVKLMSERGANAVHCPRSNLGSHGFSKTPLMLALKVNIGLGTDGAAGARLDLFEQMRLLKSAVQARYGLEINDPLALPAGDVLRMVTENGARATMLQDETGKLEAGKKADLILLDLDKPHLSPTAHLVKTIVAAAGPDDVNDVIIDGQLLVKDRVFLKLDEVEIRRKAGEVLMKVGKKAGLSLGMPYLG